MEQLLLLLDQPALYLSTALGSEITGTRLFFTLLYVYPIVIVQDLLLRGKSSSWHHLFHILSGAFLLYYNFRLESIHFLANVLIFFLFIRLSPANKWMILVSLIFNMGYLCVDYISKFVSDNNGYVVTWSTPHCVLTLKLIGLSWNLYDGMNKEESEVTASPSLLEVCGFSYYPPGLMTGPQISFQQYRKFTAGKFIEFMPQRWSYGLTRMCLGLALIITYPIFGASFASTEYMYTKEFDSACILYKMAYVLLWGQITLNRYIGVWLVAEGSCVLSGISYNGSDGTLEPRWDGSANVLLERYYSATKSQHFIDSFNVNTNKWVLTYVFKRLRFLGDRNISQVVTLIFLAIWHGLSSGYFVCFAMEFLIMYGERSIENLATEGSLLQRLLDIPPVLVACRLLTKFFSTFTLGYALVSFELGDFNLYMKVYKSLYFFPHILYMVLPFVFLLIQKPKNQQKEATKTE